MLNGKFNEAIWSECYNEIWNEMVRKQSEDETLILVPTILKLDEEGNILNIDNKNVFEKYNKKIEELNSNA